ncbi:hypothetical protein [Amycolatopsis sp. CA-230715]|uniref:hypothetical protein n=1 Tax=Amycolatopsis sp. CA-230715 TaxID=2745196 RepID=UPI001C01A970|nr:hypothetical protein [Amycolatopsis sp. CA-230715]
MADTDPSGEKAHGVPPVDAVTDSGSRPQRGATGDDPATAVLPPRAADDDTTAASLRLTDHQDAVQNAAMSAKGGSAGSAAGTALPHSGFRLVGVKSQPAVRALPGVVVNALREQLRSAAVREREVTDAAAREFSDRLSQASLVTAFLVAHLDLRLDVDMSTECAVTLFRSRDPLLGSVATRVHGLEKLETDHTALLEALRADVADLRQTAAVVEQAVAYSIADRTENFLRGSHNIRDAPITHANALFVRDRAREQTTRQARLEKEREGRPIR